jgi:hypothetical protein
MVHTVYDGIVDILTGGGNDYFLGAGGNVRACGFATTEEACAFHNQVNTQFCPWQFRRIALSEYFDPVTVYHQVTVFYNYRTRKFTVRGIVLCQVSITVGITQIIDGYDADFIGTVQFIQGTHDIATDTPIAINCNFYCHI